MKNIREMTRNVCMLFTSGLGCLAILYACLWEYTQGLLIIFGDSLKNLRSEHEYTNGYLGCFTLSVIGIFMAFLGLLRAIDQKNKKGMIYSTVGGLIAITSLVSAKFLLKGAVL